MPGSACQASDEWGWRNGTDTEQYNMMAKSKGITQRE